MHRTMKFVRLMATRLQFSINMLDVLRARFVCHQQGIWRIDNDEIVKADRSDQAACTLYSAISCAVKRNIPLNPVSIDIRFSEIAKR